jgi:hypothetical protein
MKIRDVQLCTNDKFITLSAICKIRRLGEDTVYFRFDKKNKDYIFSDASPFAAALLIPSMKQGEDLIIHSSISEALYHGMQQIMEIMLTWNIGLHPITIKADTLVKDMQNPTIVATFFSGGVDSFYTYLKHKEDTTEKLTHFLLVDGYDIDLRNTDLWKSTLANVEQVARIEGIELVTAKSNIRQLLNPILAWKYAHGGCLAAIALCLRGKLGKAYIPSSLSLSQQIPWGTHPATDHFWGTEKLAFVHDGTDVTRVEKITREVAKSPVALTHLRVCYANVRDTYNCCRCEKCLRTMIILRIADVLDQAKTFSPSIDEDLVRKLSIAEDDLMFHEENLAELKQLQIEPTLQKALETCLKNRVVMKPPFLLSPVGQQVVYLDHVYNHGRIYNVMSKALGKKFQ